MKKALSVFLLSSLVASLVVMFSGDYASAQTSTYVDGIISQDTTWTSGVYVFDGSVGVSEDVTLTVEAGVLVDLGAFDLQVNGTLIAKGTESQKVVFTSDDPSSGIVLVYGNPTCTFENAVLSGVSFSGQNTVSNAELDLISCIMNWSDVNVWGTTTIRNSYVGGAVQSRGNVHFEGNTFLDGIEVSGELTVVGNSIAKNGGAAITAWGNGVISDNIIWNSVYGINQDKETTLSATIEHNLIRNNTHGIYLRGPCDPIIKDNTFTENVVGIFNPTIKTSIVGNNFIDNGQYDIQAGVDAASAAGNWWGTIDRAEISQKIYDSNDDYQLGTIIYTPFLNGANAHSPQTPDELMSPTPSVLPTEGVVFQTVNHSGFWLSSLEVGVASAVVVAAVLVALVVQARRKRA